MRRNRILAFVTALVASGVAAIAAALTVPPAGFVLASLLLAVQADDPGDIANSASKVSVVNLSNQTCSYKVRFLDKNGTQVCELADTATAGEQTNFSTNDVPDDVYRSYNVCNLPLDDYKGHAEVFVSNVSACRQLIVVDGYVVHWQLSKAAKAPLDCVDECEVERSGEPLTSRNATHIVVDKYSGKLEKGD